MKTKKNLRVMMSEDFDVEVNALAVCDAMLRQLSFDQQWRVFNYLLARRLGRSWILSLPTCK